MQDRTSGESPGGAQVIRDRKFDSATASPLILDSNNNGSFADETAQPGFGMHANAFITFDLDKIRSENGLAGQALKLTGQAGVANFRPGLTFGAPHENKSAVILVDGLVVQLFDFKDQAAGSPTVYDQFGTTDLVIPGSARFLTFAGLDGLGTQIAGAHLGFANMRLATLTVTDTEGDGLPNAWEIQYGLNPNDSTGINGAAGDPDTDGLTNIEEFTRNTKPNDADSDDDGLNDGPEVTLGTNPLSADTDGDQLSDGDEANVHQTNPLLADTDNDGINDGAEVAAGTNPLSGPPASTYLVLHLKCEGDAQDSSVENNHGTLLNGPAFVAAGESPGGGQALSLANTSPTNNMGINVPGNSSLAFNAFTLTYWVKPKTLQEGAGLERLTSRDSDNFETAIGNRAAVAGAPDLTLSYYQTTGWHNTGMTLALNEWAHVAWRNRGTGAQDMSLFINGQLVFSGPGVPAAGHGSGLMNIGTRHNTTEGFDGLMDDGRLYRAALSNSQIGEISTPVGQAPLTILSVVRPPNGASVTLTIQSRPGRTYAVDYSTAMTATGQPGGWVELTDTLVSGGAQTIYVDTVASNLPRAFYRARDVTP